MTATMPEKMHLTLFVSGASPASVRAVRRIRELCDAYLPDRYELDIVDVYQQPAVVAANPIVAAPTLIKDLPEPLRMLIGDLADQARVIDALGLTPLASE